MQQNKKLNSWWGPPRKFSTEFEERKISWLELFYDLVYVIAISKITHNLAVHFSFSGLLDYVYFFAMIFWGWLNGSLYHDLHGSEGLRTRLMTLWQMMIVATLVITIDSSPEKLVFNATIALMAMQFYITYLWWSVGIYDKHHRKLNIPYTIIYLTALALMGITLFLKLPYNRILFFTALILNYLPPFLTHSLLRKESLELNLSSSMTERLGLFTIIVFGEVVLGIVNGIGALHELSLSIWLNFGLTLSIIFTLWWIFFTLVSNRSCKKGLINSSLLEIIYIPTLMALGLLSVVFNRIYDSSFHNDLYFNALKNTFGLSLFLFLLGINCMLYFLEYPSVTAGFKKKIQWIVFVTMVLFLILASINLQVSLFVYLLTILIILLAVIIVLNQSWYAYKQNNDFKEDEESK